VTASFSRGTVFHGVSYRKNFNRNASRKYTLKILDLEENGRMYLKRIRRRDVD
jgi:hypothetical protein